VINTNFERMIRELPPTIRNDGEQSLDYVYIDDAVDALLRLADPIHHGLTVNIASGRDISINQLTALMSRIAGSSATPLTIEGDWTAGTRRYGTTRLADERLGWEASTPIALGLQRVYDWLSRQEAADE
jgi:nucleoside-diphosphate-sugar epimerase